MARKSYRGNSNGTDWKPNADANGVPRRVADPSKDFVEGHLMEIKEGVGKNGSTVYQIKISPDTAFKYTGFGIDGDIVNIWGCTVLNNQMDDFMKDAHGGIGAWCRIEYSGRAVKKSAINKPDAALDKSDLISIYTVISDDEIKPINVNTESYTPVASNEVKASNVKMPVSIDGDDDDMPF